MKILHNAEYALSILNAVDYRSEKLVLKLFGPVSDHVLATKSENATSIVLKDIFFPLAAQVWWKSCLWA